MRRRLPTWSTPTKMFWGLVLEDHKQYSKLVDKPFHISHAALGASDSDVSVFPDCAVEIHATIEKTDYVICYLDASRSILQQTLNLNISEGEEIILYCKGRYKSIKVYLTGYFIEEPVDPYDMEDMTNDEYSVSDLSESCSEDDLTIMFRDSLSSDDSDEEYNPRSLLALPPSIEEITDDGPETEAAVKKELGGITKPQSDVKSRKRKSEQRQESNKKGSNKHRKQEQGVDGEEGGSKSEIKENISSKKKKGKKKKEVVSSHMQQEAPHKPSEVPTTKTKEKITKTKEKIKPVKLKGGTEIRDIEVGHGKLAKPGKRVFVRYTGRLAHNNKVFDSNTGTKKPFMFKLGQSEVISGWDAGINGMNVGGKRKLIIPPNHGYGAAGAPPAIPPHSKLIFDVELLDVK